MIGSALLELTQGSWNEDHVLTSKVGICFRFRSLPRQQMIGFCWIASSSVVMYLTCMPSVPNTPQSRPWVSGKHLHPLLNGVGAHNRGNLLFFSQFWCQEVQSCAPWRFWVESFLPLPSIWLCWAIPGYPWLSLAVPGYPWHSLT